MLDNKEEQINISAGLLHSFSEVKDYCVKLGRALPDGALKDEFNRTSKFLDSLQKAEIQTLRNWCSNEKT